MLKSTSHWDTNFKFQYVWEKKKILEASGLNWAIRYFLNHSG